MAFSSSTITTTGLELVMDIPNGYNFVSTFTEVLQKVTIIQSTILHKPY